MFDKETLERIDAGGNNCVINSDLRITCVVCGESQDLREMSPDKTGFPVDLLSFLGGWFAYRHADCKENK